jgi:hypothetical protein
MKKTRSVASVGLDYRRLAANAIGSRLRMITLANPFGSISALIAGERFWVLIKTLHDLLMEVSGRPKGLPWTRSVAAVCG